MPRKVMQVDGPSHFSGGNLSCSSEESRTMPRKAMQVDGPATLLPVVPRWASHSLQRSTSHVRHMRLWSDDI